MSISEARKAAYENLLRIARDDAYSSEMLASSAERLEVRNRNLCYAITLGVLRRQQTLDHLIGLYSAKSVDRLDLEILIILRLTLFQIHFLEKIPTHSAINEAVELARFARKKSATGFVNAVLRKASTWNGSFPDLPKMERISLETSHPRTLLNRWAAAFGEDGAEALALANNLEPASSFRFTSAFDRLRPEEKENIENEISDTLDISRSLICTGAFVTKKIDESLRSLADRGLIYFQDEASQMVAAVVAKYAGARILDLCAAPGSKATLISRKTSGSSEVIAGEIHLKRAKLMKINALRQQAKLSILCLDGTRPLPFENDSFDSVLVDAPCSGTGTIRRNPEIRYRVELASLAELQKKQLGLLIHASKLVNTGGVIVYSTCSLEQEENDEVITRFLNSNNHFEVFDPALEGVPADPNGFIRTSPAVSNTDGFFVAAMRKG